MTFLAIIFATIGILALFVGLVWLGRHVAFRPPVEDAPPASWITKQRGDR